MNICLRIMNIIIFLDNIRTISTKPTYSKCFSIIHSHKKSTFVVQCLVIKLTRCYCDWLNGNCAIVSNKGNSLRCVERSLMSKFPELPMSTGYATRWLHGKQREEKLSFWVNSPKSRHLIT